ncbi:hypothetical protein B0H63DRAFT_473246 [Podospora didyma]|uniref:Uncharacterized protein n=1 Tax=Podospora didyma TaxID=330526 RepID=A0AAE0TZY5_9PEZI|nr:hypothetical protein B0H63DRAFT_473246 [Podospora didyma]
MLKRLFGLGSQPPYDVWFSRNIYLNELQDWMLVVKCRKFELVRMPEGDFTFVCDYEHDWSIDREELNPGKKLRGRYGNGYDNFIMVQIGSSHLTGKEIDQRFVATCHQFPPRLSWTQAQDFLRRFTEQFVDTHTFHWRFFLDNTDFGRQCVPQLPPPPVILINGSEEQKAAAEADRARLNDRVMNFNMMNAGMMRAQQQNIAMNQQIMRNR